MKDELDFLPSAFRSGTYILTTKEGIRYEISGTTGDLMTVSDTNGNTLTFTDAGITSNTGASVTFERDAQNRITSVIDPLGQKVSYRYDANGDLIAVTDRAGSKEVDSLSGKALVGWVEALRNPTPISSHHTNAHQPRLG